MKKSCCLHLSSRYKITIHIICHIKPVLIIPLVTQLESHWAHMLSLFSHVLKLIVWIRNNLRVRNQSCHVGTLTLSQRHIVPSSHTHRRTDPSRLRLVWRIADVQRGCCKVVHFAWAGSLTSRSHTKVRPTWLPRASVWKRNIALNKPFRKLVKRFLIYIRGSWSSPRHKKKKKKAVYTTAKLRILRKGIPFRNRRRFLNILRYLQVYQKPGHPF